MPENNDPQYQFHVVSAEPKGDYGRAEPKELSPNPQAFKLEINQDEENKENYQKVPQLQCISFEKKNQLEFKAYLDSYKSRYQSQIRAQLNFSPLYSPIQQSHFCLTSKANKKENFNFVRNSSLLTKQSNQSKSIIARNSKRESSRDGLLLEEKQRIGNQFKQLNDMVSGILPSASRAKSPSYAEYLEKKKLQEKVVN